MVPERRMAFKFMLVSKGIRTPEVFREAEKIKVQQRFGPRELFQ